MTTILSIILFTCLLGYAVYRFAQRVRFIISAIGLGQKDNPRNDQKGRRFAQMALFALGQKKMFKRPFPAVMHLLIYIGFILINLELVEIIADGLTGQHRILQPLLGGFYPILISFLEVLAVGVFISCIVFLWRRNVSKVARFHKVEMKGWPTMDANLILVFEIILVAAMLKMNAADMALQQMGAAHYAETGDFLVSSYLVPMFSMFGKTTLIFMERALWWVHIAGILFFLNYVTYSKHLHIILAFPNTWFGDLDKPKGEMENMPLIQNEVAAMLNPDAAPAEAGPVPDHFGAKDVTDLSWKNLLDAWSCTECGRCTSACPANITGKKLSPRKIMMDTRDRMEELTAIKTKDAQAQDEHILYGNFITQEELKACTTCNACVEECPVNISPLDIILKMRRHMVMDMSEAPNEWNIMMGNIENNMAPWAFSPDDRSAWAADVETKQKIN